jgi:hypothetical protein
LPGDRHPLNQSSRQPDNKEHTTVTTKATLEIAPAALLRREKDIPFSQLDDELLAIDAQAGYCYSLNPTAGRVWELIAMPMTLDALCAQLRREYAVDEPTCRREVTALLQGLCDAGLVQMAG